MIHPMLNTAIAAARQAGDLIVRYSDRLETLTFAEKQKNDFVSEVDQHCEQLIIQTIQERYPDHSFLAEEGSNIEGDSDYLWIIDPLDGTNNFMHGIPHFCVSIAVQVKGRLEQGVIYDPIRQELFTASRGNGARLNQRRLRVSTHQTLDGALLGTGFPYKAHQSIKTYLATLETIMPIAAGLRRAGSAALDLAYVAAGRFDGFWEMDLSAWDIAAGALLIKEAGGLVGGFDGSENYLETGNVIAGNPKIFKELLKSVQVALR
jgi:myo-inositol-1(or 4)-monophosphatase